MPGVSHEESARMKQRIAETIKPPSPSTELIDQMLESGGLGDYGDTFKKHNIVDEQLHLMNADMLKEMGVESVGHRLYMVKILKQAQMEYKAKVRNTVIWQASAIRHGEGFCEYLKACGCMDCCFLSLGCIDPTDEYKLTGSTLSIKSVDKLPPYMKLCCLRGKRSTDHIDLSAVKDMDTETNPQCCSPCGCTSQYVNLTVDATRETTSEGAKEYSLIVENADEVYRLLNNAVEENQHMDRM